MFEVRYLAFLTRLGTRHPKNQKAKESHQDSQRTTHLSTLSGLKIRDQKVMFFEDCSASIDVRGEIFSISNAPRYPASEKSKS